MEKYSDVSCQYQRSNDRYLTAPSNNNSVVAVRRYFEFSAELKTKNSRLDDLCGNHFRSSEFTFSLSAQTFIFAGISSC